MIRPLVASSIDLIKRNQAASGAYIAAPGYDTYQYSWLRDGAFIAAALDTHGQHNSAAAFHAWAANTIERHAHKVERLEDETEHALRGTGDPLHPIDDCYVLHTRFTIDGGEGNNHWGNFQLDGYGFWLTSIAQHLHDTGEDPAPYLNAIDLVRRYLTLTWQQPCYDSWEEYPTRRHTTTWAAIARGLSHSATLLDAPAAASTADTITKRLLNHSASHSTLHKFVPEHRAATEPPPAHQPEPTDTAVAGHERIGRPLDSHTVDGSVLLVLDSFGPFAEDDEVCATTAKVVEDQLVVGGGVHRYLEDEYYGGGLWIVLAGALAHIQATRDPHRADEILDWIETQADTHGHLGEQTHLHLRKPDKRQAWIQRWGHPAKPLLWSHAMYLLAAARTRRS